MIGFVDAPRAWSCTRGMARISGLNLTGAVLDGWLSRSEVIDLVRVCAACELARECTCWLAQSAQIAAIPRFCPNKAGIEQLAPPT